MERMSRPPSHSENTAASEKTVRWLGTGAIAAPMAVSFREEKLALCATRMAGAGRSNVPIMVHSHLRWDFVWQRPQQLLSRFAADHRVLFVEDPMESASEPALDISLTPEGVVRVVPLLPKAASLSTDARCAMVLPLLESALRTHPLLAGRFESPIQWFYSPMNAPRYCDQLGSVATVYDCMDELSAFRFAPPDIAERENYLLRKADLVFTGGYELYSSKSRRHANTHFFGCGVDADHFARARAEETVIPAEVAALPSPILGYFGVIDERLDYELIAELARRCPTASIVMVGPLAKVHPEELPQASNIHWLGCRTYGELPALVKAFDICLMPFAMNAATQYINPTKTLEYLAAGKPVVSTAVPDVVRQYTDVVDIADSVKSFVSLVEKRLVNADPERIARGIARARSSSWDSTVTSMRGHLLNTLALKRGRPHKLAMSAALFGAHFTEAEGGA